jgi:metal-dependent amidase/aminoacylase/carboxypeptidase family protein
VSMLGTIRTFDTGVREELHARLRKTVGLVAQASGAEATVTIDPYAPVTGNDPELLRQMMPTLEWAAGEGNVLEHELITGAEDFAHFEQRIPGLYLMLGINKEGVAPGEAASNHSPLFYVNEDALIVGVRTFVGLALGYAEATAP